VKEGNIFRLKEGIKMSTKTAVNPVAHSVMEPVRERWSPRAFAERPVETKKLQTLFEAARWSASSYNEQPWRFIVVHKHDAQAFERMLGVANEWNQSWARLAPVLILTIAKKTFTKSGKPNRHSWYDLGSAVGYMSLEAVRHNLFIHQMAGFDAEKAKAQFNIPDGFEAVSLLALGYQGDVRRLPEDLRESEQRKRERKPQTDFVFEKAFGEAAKL
jgi:nitroreductase